MGRTIYFNKNNIISASSIAGPKECSGILGKYIHEHLEKDTFKDETFEQAECRMLYSAICRSIKNSRIKEKEVDCLLAGDLLNQIISATFSARNLYCGYLGLYSACSTFTEALLVGSLLLDNNSINNVVCATSSHFSTAERQYRYPLELGSTRPPQSQWTVTGAGACLLSKKGNGPSVTCGTIGKVIDFGVTDTNNMGAAMAPACADTLSEHFTKTNTTPDNYDLIITGDLGTLGTRILKDLIYERGYDIEKQHVDCGELIYNIKEDEFQGGSGAGCISIVFCSYIYHLLKTKKINKVLLLATGALLSSVSSQQGESIPGISHAVCLENLK